MTTDADDALQAALRAEASRIHESAVYSGQGQLEASKLWRLLQWLLGIVAAGTSAVTAVLTFADHAQIACGVLAVVAAVAATALATCQPEKLAQRAARSGNDYIALRNDVRRLHHIRMLSEPAETVRAGLDELAARAAELDRESDPIPWIAYFIAKRNIDRHGGQRFEVDPK